MVEASLDQSKNLKLTYRKGEGRPFTITLKDEDGDSVETTELGEDFTFAVVDISDKDTPLFLLEESSGGDGCITNDVGNGILTIDPLDEDVNLEEGPYELVLKCLTENGPFTVLSAPFIINNSPLGEEISDTASVTINTGATNINLTLAGAVGGGTVEDGTMVWKGKFNLTTAAGILPSGSDKKQGWTYVIELNGPDYTAITVGMEDLYHKSVVSANRDNPTNDFDITTGWTKLA